MYPSVLLKVADNCEAGDFLQASAIPMGYSWSNRRDTTCIKYASQSTQQGVAFQGCIVSREVYLNNMSAPHRENDTG